MRVSAADDLRHLMRALPAPYVVMTPDLVIVDVTDAYVESVGRSRSEVIGRMLFEAFPPGPDEVDEYGIPFAQRSLERARDTLKPDRMPLTSYGVRDGSTGELVQRWWSLVSFPVLGDGHCVLVGLLAEDVTDLVGERARSEALRVRARESELDVDRQAHLLSSALRAEEVASRRVRSLAEVALALTTAATIDALPSIIAPGLDVLETDGGGLIVPGTAGGWLSVTEALAGGVAEPSGAEIPYDSPLPGPYVGRIGQPLLLLDREASLAFDADVMSELSEQTGREAWACLPITAGTEVLGVLTVSWASSRTLSLQRIRATEEQHALAERALRLSETLQRSLLTTPAKHEMLDIAVRYLPAAEEAQVGGDWYDVFVTRAGRTLLVVGDVSGHDRTAAAMMGQVRNLLRGLAFDSVDGPAALLSRLDAALLGLDFETLATCVVVSIERVGGICRIRWSNAGHLALLLRLPDGSVAPLNGSDDLLLGLDPDTERHEGVLDLATDSVLLLCTDGLVERRAVSLDDGLDRLAAAVSDGPGHDPEALCEHVLAALDDGRSEDDIALLVARVGTC